MTAGGDRRDPGHGVRAGGDRRDSGRGDGPAASTSPQACPGTPSRPGPVHVAVDANGMTHPPWTPAEPLADRGGWEGLAGALAVAGAGGPNGDVEWALREARMLVLDGRATLPALVGLARRHAYGGWPTLRDCATGTAGHVLAVLRGWDRASVPGTGHVRGDLPGAFPTAPVEVAAVWCAAAAHRLGLDGVATGEWAQCGLLDPADAPDPGWVADPHDGPDADPAPRPEDDDTYELLRWWRRLVGAHDAPACYLAGLDPKDAAQVLSLPRQHPDRRRLLGY